MLSVRRAVGWTEAHSHRPAHVVHTYNRTIVIAAADGYIALLEWNFASIDIVREIEISLNAGKPTS